MPPGPAWAPSLDRDRRFDVAVLGGGIVGATAALLLAREGLSVGLVEAHRWATASRGTRPRKSLRSTRRSTPSCRRASARTLPSPTGRRRRRGWRRSQTSRRSSRSTATCGASLRSSGQRSRQPWSRYARRRTRRGPRAYPRLSPGKRISVGVPGAVRFDRQAEFHPVKYLVGLARAAREAGAEIFHHTRAIGADDGETCTVRTDGGHTITASHVIVATHIPFLDRGGYFARTHPERSLRSRRLDRGSGSPGDVHLGRGPLAPLALARWRGAPARGWRGPQGRPGR